VEVAVPQWIAYVPNGDVFDEQGFQPDIRFEYRPDAFEGEKDELLSLALATLRKEAAPAQPIAGPSVQEFRARRAAEKVCRPKVIAVEPRDATTGVDPRTALRIRFDRPMHPSTVLLAWKAGSVADCDRIQYDATANQFTIPAVLEPGCTHRIVINPPVKAGSPAGFTSAHGTPAGRYEWTFTTAECTSGVTAEKPPPVIARPVHDVVAAYNRKRAAMRSFIETQDTVELSQPGQGGFHCLRAYTMVFTLQGPEKYLVDVSDVCGMPMVLFCDGAINNIAGYYRHEGSAPEAVFCRSDDLARNDLKLADPFDVCAESAVTVSRQLKLRYAGTANVAGRRCHVVVAPAGSASDRRPPCCTWWIDVESHRLVRAAHDERGGRSTHWYSFERVNEPLAHLECMPGVPYQEVYRHRRMDDPLPDRDASRFVEIHDGCRGTFRARWGQCGPAGEQYVGL
jgi:hypothetical protein